MKTVSRKKKKSSDVEEPVVNDLLQKAFADFVLYCPAQRFSRNLRSMLIKYLVLCEEKKPEQKELLTDLEILFRLLEVIAEERPRWLRE